MACMKMSRCEAEEMNCSNGSQSQGYYSNYNSQSQVQRAMPQGGNFRMGSSNSSQGYYSSGYKQDVYNSGSNYGSGHDGGYLAHNAHANQGMCHQAQNKFGYQVHNGGVSQYGSSHNGSCDFSEKMEEEYKYKSKSGHMKSEMKIKRKSSRKSECNDDSSDSGSDDEERC